MGVPQTLPADFQGWDKSAPANTPPATLPANFAQWDDAPKKDAYGTPPAEIDSFLKSNPNYQFLDTDPKFPNRRPGIYPSGPGNEWRNDPALNAKKGNVDQFPVDPHLLKHSYQSGKQALGVATAPMLFEASLPQILGGLLGGAGGSVVGSSIAKAAGAGQTGQEVAGDVGGLAGGMAGSATGNYAASKGRAIWEALPSDIQSAVKKNAAAMAGGYRLKKALDLWDTIGDLKERFVKTGGVAQELDATGENKDFAGEPAPRPTPWNAHDATGENKPFAGGMDEFTPRPMRPTVQPQAAAPFPVPAPMQPTVQPSPVPQSAAGSMVRSVTQTPQKADPLLVRLRLIASDIEAHEKGAAQPTTDEDLTGLLLQSLAQVKARKGIQ